MSVGSAQSQADRKAHAGLVLIALDQAARAGAPCPTNDELTALLGDYTASYTSTLVAQLQAQRLIKVERTGRARRVTIAATGMATDWTKGARSRAIDAVLAQLADLVADGMSVNAAGARLGYGPARTWQLWAKIRAAQGDQAQ